jgi:DNA polymerase III subunit beta
MLELSLKKEDLLSPLLTAAGAVDKKNSLAILSHFLLTSSDGALRITATDLEIEITAHATCDSHQTEGSIAVPAKKIIDIVRSLDDGTEPHLSFDNGVLSIKQGRSSFKVATLPAEHYPVSQDECNDIELTLPRVALLSLLQSTHFAMTQQDVRVYLNGLLMEFEDNTISTVATDGHRMAICRYACPHSAQGKLLLPKKGVQELLRLLHSIDEEYVLIAVGSSHFKLTTHRFVFLSKLIEARFPPYAKAIPRNQDKQVRIDCALFKKALTRIVILAHEKSKAVMLHMEPNQLTLIANNNEQEEAVEHLTAETTGDDIKIGLNASYLLDVLNHFNEGMVILSLAEANSSILIESEHHAQYQYIIMPMKI